MYQEEEEVLLDLADMAAYILHRWKIVAISAVILMALVGGYMSFNDYTGIQNKYQESTLSGMTKDMTDEQIETVNQFFNRYLTYKQRIANNQFYIDNSIRMKLDANNVSISKREYLVKTKAMQVLSSFAEAALDLEDYKKMAEVIGGNADPRYASELVSIGSNLAQDAYDIDTDKVGDVINGSFNNSYNGILTLTVTYNTKEDCDKLTDIADKAIMEHYEKLKNAGVELEIEELTNTYTEKVDSNLFEFQQSMIETGANLVTDYYDFQKSAETSLDEDEEALFKYMIEKNEEVQDKIHWKKWMAIGFAAGMMLAFIVIAVMYLMMPAIKNGEDGNRLAKTRELGLINQNVKAKVVFGRFFHEIARRLESHGNKRIPEAESVPLVCDRIAQIAKQKEIDRLFLICDAEDEFTKDVTERCRETLKTLNVTAESGNPIISVEAIKKLRETDGAVLVMTTKVSLPDSIKGNKAICEENNIPVIGSFVICPQN